MRVLSFIKEGLHYIGSRLGKKSTIIGFGTAVTAASAVPAPWCYPVAALGILAVLYPAGADS